MAVTPFKFLPLFRTPKIVEIPKRLGVRAVVVDSSNNFLLTLQDILNPDLSLMFGKMQVIKKYSRFSRFLLLRQDYSLLSNSNCWQIIDMYMPAHKILLLIASGSNKGSDEPAHQHRAFAARMHKIWI